MRATSILSLLSCLAYLPFASAWIYTWHSPNDTLLSFQGEEPLSCKSMDNPKDNVFNWEPQDGHWLTNNTAAFFTTTTSSEPATKTASESSTATNATSTTPSAPTTPSASTATTTSEPTDSDSKASLSSGAIAGIVVGALAALAIAGILIFFLCWRRRKNDAQKHDNTRTESASGMVELSSSHHDGKNSSISEKPRSRQETLRELNGSTVASEIGTETERHELYTERYELDSTLVEQEKKP
ncbi:unnamed protein product [Penicillium manginii]